MNPRIEYALGKGAEILGQVRAWLIGAVVGAAVTLAAVFALSKPVQPADPGKTVTVNQISGEKIEHQNWHTGGDIIRWRTVAAGAGEIETTLQKDAIPEAYAWRHKTRGTTLNAAWSIRGTRSVEALYSQRWGPAALNGGARVDVYRDGGIDMAAVFGGTYWFDKWFWE